jgi:chaperonin GroES
MTLTLVNGNGTKIEAAPSPIKYLPTWDRLLIRPVDKRDKTKSGLYLPGTSARLIEGEVLACGPGRVENAIRVDHGFKVGDVVVFSDEAMLQVDPEADDQRLVAAGAVLAIKAKVTA